MIKGNRLKKAFNEGRVAKGIEHFVGNKAMVEVAADMGFDFNLIDMHQSPLTFQELDILVSASNAGGITSLVRVLEYNPSLINLALNVGADGIIVPDVSTAERAREVVQAVKYPPVGGRLGCPSIRAAKYGLIPWKEYEEYARENIMSCVIVESREGMDNIADIASVPGIDIIWLGAWDLSFSLGIPCANFTNPTMMDCLKKAAEECRKNNVILFTTTAVTTSSDYFNLLVDAGVNMVCIFTDIGLFSRACRRVLDNKGI
jgi:4-hydroxy-2-oxoheptanedioate aldolase